MSSERIDAYAEALFAIARAEGELGEVEDELFRFARTFEASDELRDTLSDPHIAPTIRQQIVIDLLGGKARPLTVNLVGLIVAGGRARDLPEIVSAVVELSASAANKAVAEVRSAIPLTGDQTTRLAEALGRATGKQVEVKVIVDPTVKGGLVAQVGDTVIDGTVRRRLEQLKNTL